MGGLIGITRINMSSENQSGINDLNNFKENFSFIVFRNMLNPPKDILAGIAISLRINNKGWFKQLVLSSDQNSDIRMYSRTYDADNKVWTAWNKLSSISTE